MKRELGKEKSPAGEKLLEFFRNGCKNLQLLARSARSSDKQIFANAIAQNILTAIFHMRVCFLNVKIKFYTEPIYAYNKLFIFILDSTGI